MDIEGVLYLERRGEREYFVSFTPRGSTSGGRPAPGRLFESEEPFAGFLLAVGFGASRADDIQAEVRTVRRHTVDNFRISEDDWRRLFPQSLADAETAD